MRGSARGNEEEPPRMVQVPRRVKLGAREEPSVAGLSAKTKAKRDEKLRREITTSLLIDRQLYSWPFFRAEYYIAASNSSPLDAVTKRELLRPKYLFQDFSVLNFIKKTPKCTVTFYNDLPNFQNLSNA